MSKRVLIATGGTGGHVFPAQGLADELLERMPDIDIFFVGGGLETNRYFDRQRPHQQVDCSPLNALSAVFKIGKGVFQSAKLIRSFKPDLIVGFGSYYTFPPLVAAQLWHIPIVLHVADSIPGKVNRFFAPYAVEVGVNFPHTRALIKGNASEVGMPLRKELRKGKIPREEALAYFNLSRDSKTLLVFGGSQGAAALNRCLQACKDFSGFQVIHITGQEAGLQDMAESYKNRGIRACVKSFENRMACAWEAADLFIGRAGASTLAEALEFEVPGLVIPYPSAAENHQEKNADYLVSTIGGGVKLLEADMTKESLEQMITLMSSPLKRAELRAAMGSYKKRALTRNFCDLVMERL